VSSAPISPNWSHSSVMAAKSAFGARAGSGAPIRGCCRELTGRSTWSKGPPIHTRPDLVYPGQRAARRRSQIKCADPNRVESYESVAVSSTPT
jgi:hypothetical protein